MTLTIPSELQNLVRDDNKNAKIYVQVHNGGIAYREIVIAPDTSDLTPAITSISTTDIKPGQLVVIEGRNFLNNQGQGIPWISAAGVNFLIASESLIGEVKTWGDTYIGVTMPPVEGKLGQNGLVQVKNKRGLVSAPVSFTFVPTLSRIILNIQHKVAGDIFAGITKTYDDNVFQLINQWKVVEAYLAADTNGNAGAYFRRQPSPGSIDAHSIVRLWADAWCSVSCTNWLIIQGPAGLPYK